MADPILISVKGACKSLNLGKTTVYDLMKRGILKSGKHGAKRLLSFLSVKDYAEKLVGQDQEADAVAETDKEEPTPAQPDPEPAPTPT